MHDLRNRLQMTSAHLSLARRRLAAGSGDGASEHLEAAIHEIGIVIQQFGHVVDAKERFSAIHSGTDPGQMIRTVEPKMRAILGDAVVLEIVCLAGACTVPCGSEELEDAIMNLVLNARDAIKDSGAVAVQISRAGPILVISVSDDGEGMDKSVQARAFEPYFTTKPDGRGTGLGLFQISSLMERIGGSIRIESNKGIGTSMILGFPCADS